MTDEQKSLDSPGVPAAISRKLLYDINSYAIRAYYEPHRWHLGASLIGHECSAYLWFVFRWCGTEANPNDVNAWGRKLRLFNRGHREEDRFIEYLRGIGCDVWTHDESQPPQGGEYPQFRMSAVDGHYGGSIDAIIRFPANYGIVEPVLGEFKTNGTGKSFSELIDVGVQRAKTQHFVQMSVYGQKYQLRYGAYFNVNKNDDDLHVEVVKLNWDLAQGFEKKAYTIIYSTTRPGRLSETPTFWKCQYCSMKKVCHEGAKPERNCRSCKFAQPSEGGEWFCGHHGQLIPREFVPKGCDSYKAIINDV